MTLTAPALPTACRRWTAMAHRTHNGWRRVAESDAAVVVVFLWAVGEATVQPIVPDLALGLLALGTRRRLCRLLLAALAGMTLGGICTLTFAELAPATATGVLLHLPFIHLHGLVDADAYVRSHGIARGFLHQPWSGIPFKVWAVDAGRSHLDPWTVIPWFVAGRTLRIAFVTGAVAGIAALLDRAHLLRAAFPVIAMLGLAGFAWGFQQIVVT